MNKFKKCILSVIWLSMTFYSFGANSQPLSERKIELDAIKMTYSDLSNVLSNIELLIESANQSVPKKEYNEESVEISISSGQDTIRLTGWQSFKEEQYLPPKGYSVRFRYSYSNAPISYVTLTLADGIREIQVSGSDRSQVNAISLALRDSLDKHSTKFGGIGFRAICALVFIVSVMLLISLFFHKLKYIVIIQAVTAIGANIIIYALPWDKWIAGFTIYLDSASFIDRNINMMSFVGILISIAVPLIGFGVKAANKVQQSKEK
ncbi:hypothetical protein H8Q52_002729 [Vibrio parahaemolyticus]|nr:hypothetical protein [Vibrio parahaemolyticus]